MIRSTSLLVLTLALFCLLLPLTSLLGPKIVAPMLAVAGLVVGGLAWRAGLPLRLPDRPIAAVTLALLAWCAVTLFWAPGVERAAVLIGRVAVLLAAGGVLFATASALEDEARVLLGRCIALGVGLSVAIIVIELTLDYPITRLFRPGSSGYEIRTALNRGATAMAILVWPAAAWLWTVGRRSVALALLIATGLVLPFLASLAAVTGFTAGVVVTALASANRKAGWRLLIVATLAAFLLSPMAGRVFNAADLQDAQWLPSSAQHRIEIWNFTAELIAEKPLFGWGFDAARYVSDIVPETADGGRAIMTLHPHNALLQILLEIGVVGGAIGLALLLLLVTRLEVLPRPTHAFAQGMYAASLTIAAVAYGVWQNQWLALLISAAALLRLIAPRQLPRRQPTAEADRSVDARA